MSAAIVDGNGGVYDVLGAMVGETLRLYQKRLAQMAKSKEKVLVHYFKVTMYDDPTASGVAAATAALEKVADSVEYLRSAMRSKDVA